MSNEEGPAAKNPPATEDEPVYGPNLALIYSLVGAALLFAIGFAALIVLPFYRHRH